jgi:competence protein ComEC
MIYVVAAGLVLGECAAADLRAVPWWLGPACAALAAVAALLPQGRAARRVLFGTSVLGLAAVAGIWLAVAAETPPADAAHVGRLVLPWRGPISAAVLAEPVRRAAGTTVLVEIREVGVGANARAVRGRARLTLRRRLALHAGDRLAAWVTLRRPRSFRSPGAFDFAAYLARRGVHVVGTVWQDPPPRRVGREPPSLATAAARWRRAAMRALASGTDEPLRQVLAALVLGRGDTLAPEVRESFRRAGVVHVLVVSGLHVTLVAGVAARLLGAILGRSERLLLHTDVDRLARIASLLPVAAYVVLVGPSVSVGRAVLASLVAVLALVCGRPVGRGRSWALALVAVAVLWPGSPREAGCQLSFASVGGVLLALPREPIRQTVRERIRSLLVVALTVAVVTAPVTALHFDALAPTGVVANPIVVPLFGTAVLGPGLLGAALAPLAPAAAAWLFAIAGWLVRPGVAVTQALGALAPLLPVPRPNALELLALHGLLAGWFGRTRRAWRRVGLAAAVVLASSAIWWVWERHAPGRLRVAFLDVGQGDAAVVELPDGRVLVVDAGGFAHGALDPGRAVVEPYLRSRKIARIDALVMSHAHPDHAGGLPRLVERFAPREFWWAGIGGEGPSWEVLHASLRRHAVPVRALVRSERPPGFAGVVEVLHPPRGWEAPGLNDDSLVLAVAAGPSRLLLTGDAEAAAERAMRAASADGPSRLLKVPHHGSRTSSTPGWLVGVAPRIAIVSVGADNPYRLPAPDVERRYRALGACVLRTDRCGTITALVAGGHARVRGVAPGCGCSAPLD